jgi:hypothetical protein
MADETVTRSAPATSANRTLAERKTVWTLREITQLAESVRILCEDVIGDSGADWPEEAVQKLVAARGLSCQAGIMADIGLRDLGDGLMCRHRDAAGWLCPPAYHAEDSKEVSHG